MDTVIANRDYRIAKKFIEKNIGNPNLLEQDKIKFGECYRLLNVRNAKAIYCEVYRLLNVRNTDASHKFDMSVFKIGAAFIFIAFCIWGLCDIAKLVISPQSTLYTYILIIKPYSVLIFMAGLSVILAIGH